jgi:glycerol-3-phosphate dehydrogenase (NAD(P)+)
MTLGIVGGGAWGTALGALLADQAPVRLWAREPGVVSSINDDHVNSMFLPGISLPRSLSATGELATMAACEVLLIVTPAQFVRRTLGAFARRTTPLVLCAKGLAADTMQLMSEVAAEICPRAPLAILSGPTFAAEVARRLPTAVTLACADQPEGERMAGLLARPHFRPYYTSDVIGAEIGGAVKNVLAIACGVAAGAGLGQNAQAALIARGFAEMARFGAAKGARAETLAGLSGLGDLVLTCSSEQSRNFSLGIALGEGKDATSVLAAKNSVAEGAFTAPVLQAAARARAVDMPVVDAVCALLGGTAAVGEVMRELLARPLKPER